METKKQGAGERKAEGQEVMGRPLSRAGSPGWLLQAGGGHSVRRRSVRGVISAAWSVCFPFCLHILADSTCSIAFSWQEAETYVLTNFQCQLFSLSYRGNCLNLCRASGQNSSALASAVTLATAGRPVSHTASEAGLLTRKT